MIWLTWRQHRRDALLFAVVCAAMAAYLVVTGRAMYGDYYHMLNGTNVARCIQYEQQSNTCATITSAFFNAHSGETQPALFGLLALPLLVGMFLGAPLLARELETGTFRLVWTQSVMRLRWLLVKIGMSAGAVALLFAAFIPLVYWWKGPFNLGGSGIGGATYPIEGIIPLAYVTFALALGLAAGALLRRTVAAMAATLAGYLAVALALGNWVRPNLLPPRTLTWNPLLSEGPTSIGRHDWILYLGYLDRAGQHIDPNTVFQTCAPSGAVDLHVGSAYNACVHAHGWLSTIVWQPADRYWAFQGIESAILLALAATLLALTIWLVRRG